MSRIEDGLRTLFTELDSNSTIVDFETVNAEDNFTVLVRTKLAVINSDNWSKTCDRWMEKFTAQTNSKWVVKTTFPKLKRLDYRKVYVCKQNSTSSRNKNKSCRAKIDIKIKKVTDNTLRRDRYLRNGYNGEIKVIFDHCHDR